MAYSHGLPIAIHAGSASPREVTLVEKTLEHNHLSGAPEHSPKRIQLRTNVYLYVIRARLVFVHPAVYCDY